MKRALIAAIVGGFILVGAVSIYAATDDPASQRVLGTGPITEQQIRDKLGADGFTNIQITPRSILETVATKDGRQLRLAIDAQSGTAVRIGDDDDD